MDADFRHYLRTAQGEEPAIGLGEARWAETEALARRLIDATQAEPALRALKQEGLAASRRDGKIVFYSLSDVGVELLDSVLEATDASQAPIEAAR